MMLAVGPVAVPRRLPRGRRRRACRNSAIACRRSACSSILRAFASGATALTGVEAIADGVPGVPPPAGEERGRDARDHGRRSASRCSSGSRSSPRARHPRERSTSDRADRCSRRSATTVFVGRLPASTCCRSFTAAILILAANTAYQDFPRLSVDPGARPLHAVPVPEPRRPVRLLERRHRARGRRVPVGLGVRRGADAADPALRGGRVHRVHPVPGGHGAPVASGSSEPNWQRYAARSTASARPTTGIVLVIVTLTKFSRGAWIVILAIPVIVGFFLAVHHHYEKVGRILRERGWTRAVVAARTRSSCWSTTSARRSWTRSRYLRAVRAEGVVPLLRGSAGPIPRDGRGVARPRPAARESCEVLERRGRPAGPSR